VTKALLSAIDDICGFTAHVLTTLSPSKLAYSIFHIEGERASLSGIAAMYDGTSKIYDKGMANTGGTSNKLWAAHTWKGIKRALNT